MTTNNTNLNTFATTLSQIIDQSIGLDHIHASVEGRFYYIQSPKEGSPMLLEHYRGPFFVDIHPNDLKKIESGEISPVEYIETANWQIGYYWGGGSMVSGGYYQPCDIIAHKDEVRRYFKILRCRTYRGSSGYMPTEDQCSKCPVDNCPFSRFKSGTWETEFKEYDPRIDFFKALMTRFEKENPGYTLRGFLCGNIDDDEIYLNPNGRYQEDDPRSFMAYASSNVIRSLLMRETTPEDWDEYVKGFTFRLHKLWTPETYDVTPENLEKIYEGMDYTVKVADKENDDFLDADSTADDSPKGFFAVIGAFFKRIF